MKYKIIKMRSKSNIVSYKYEVHIKLGDNLEVISPHYSFKTEEKAIKEAEKEIRKQEKILAKIKKIVNN